MAEKITDKQLEEIKKGLEASGIAAAEVEKLLKSISNSSKEVANTLIESFSALEKNKNLYKETLELSVEQERANSRINKETAQYNVQRLEYLEANKNFLDEEEAIKKRILLLEKKQIDNSDVLTEDEKKEIESGKVRLSQIQLELEKLKAKRDSLEKTGELLNKETELNEKIQRSFESQLTSLTGMSGMWNNISNGTRISSALFAQFAQNAGELLSKVSKGNADFAKTTGQIAERSINFGYGLSQFGIGFEELNKASMELYTSMSDFSNLNKSTQKDLAESAAKMELLGVSSATTGKILNDLTKGMRMTAQEASQTSEYIAKVAVGIGVAPSKMAADFAAAMPKLQAHGKQGIEVFAQLQKQSKSLGMEMNTLMGIVGDTFDTFEGGARAAGKLNAILGGDYLNSVEMLNATESERVELLKRSFDMSGKNFDSLDKYEKKAIAASLGISDLNEASKLLGNSTADMTEDMRKQAASQEKLEEVQREAVETQKKMNEIFNAFLVIIRPLVYILEGAINVITRVNDVTGGLGGIVIGLTSAFFFFGGSIGGVLSKITGLAGAVGGLKDKFGILRETMNGMGGGFKGLKAGIQAAFGGGMIGPQAPTGPIPAPAIPATNPAAAFSFQKTMISLRNGIQAFATNPGKTLLGALILTAVSAMLAGTLALFATSLKSFNGIDFGQVMKGIGVLTLLTLAAIGLGAGPVPAMVALGALALLGLSIAFYALGESLIKLSGGLSALTEFNISLSALTNAGAGATLLVSTISEISDALKEIPEGKTITLNALNQTLTTARTITEEEIKPTKDFVSAVKDYYIAQKDSKESDKDPLVNALKELKAMLAPKQESNEPLTVKLVLNNGQTLDGKMFGLQKASGLING